MKQKTTDSPGNTGNKGKGNNKMGEGKENSAVTGKAKKKASYPLPAEKDKQFNNQPEFIESQANKKSEE